jgi:hypothetical protein
MFDCKSFAQYNRFMKWLDDLKYKLWWRGINIKDLAILATLPPMMIGLAIFMVYVLFESM